MKKYNKSHIGEVHTTNENLGSYVVKVIDGGSKKYYCTIQIEEWISEVLYGNVVKGQIKYPYHPSVFGIGYFGSSKTTKSKAHSIWTGMIQRVYDPLYHKTRPAYIGVTVCTEWHNFSVFEEWFNKNYVIGYELDKDLLSKGTKIYSPETCCFIPQDLNSFLANRCSSNTSGYTGVSWSRRAKKWKGTIHSEGTNKHLGYFNTAEEASIAYIKARHTRSAEIVDRYKDVLPVSILNEIK